jgi:hypothetical protein
MQKLHFLCFCLNDSHQNFACVTYTTITMNDDLYQLHVSTNVFFIIKYHQITTSILTLLLVNFKGKAFSFYFLPKPKVSNNIKLLPMQQFHFTL